MLICRQQRQDRQGCGGGPWWQEGVDVSWCISPEYLWITALPTLHPKVQDIKIPLLLCILYEIILLCSLWGGGLLSGPAKSFYCCLFVWLKMYECKKNIDHKMAVELQWKTKWNEMFIVIAQDSHTQWTEIPFLWALAVTQNKKTVLFNPKGCKIR